MILIALGVQERELARFLLPVRPYRWTNDVDSFLRLLCSASGMPLLVLCSRPTSHMRAWRLAAWAVCGVAYLAHIAYERIRLRNSRSSAALHSAFAVALGASFGLAVGANIHSLSMPSTNQHRHLLILSLGIWLAITAVPAFLVALGINILLARR